MLYMSANPTHELIEATLIGNNNILIWDIDSAQRLYWEGFFGKPLGIKKPKAEFNKPLQLSFFEAVYLVEKNQLKILDANTGDYLSKEKLIDIAKESYSDFLNEYIIYKYLRDKGYVVRPGLKFGARFAVYEHGPGIDHAPFLVHVVSKRFQLSAIDLLRAGRLATSVKKKFIIAMINEKGEPEFFGFSWFKP